MFNSKRKLLIASIFSAVALSSTGAFASSVFSNIGVVAPYEKIHITSETTGVVKSINKDIGDRVHRGSTIVLIDSTDHLYNLNMSRLEKENASAELSYQSDRFKRITKLRQSNNASQSELDDVTFDLERSKIELKQKELNQKISQTDYDRTNISPTIDGIVVSKNIDVGQFVQPSTILFEIIDHSKLKVETRASVSEVKEMKVGDKVVVKSATKNAKSVEGTITNIGVSFSDNMAAYPVVIEIPFTSDLRISETVSVEFNK